MNGLLDLVSVFAACNGGWLRVYRPEAEEGEWHGYESGHSSIRLEDPPTAGGTVMEDYFRVMEQIERRETAVFPPKPTMEKVNSLLDMIEQQGMSDKQQQILAELHNCLI